MVSRNEKVPINIGSFLPFIIAIIPAALLVAGTFYVRTKELAYQNEIKQLKSTKTTLEVSQTKLTTQLSGVNQQLEVLNHQDQKVRNDQLEAEINQIQSTYKDTVVEYEDLLRMKEITPKTNDLDELFAQTLNYLSNRNYASAAADVKLLSVKITALRQAMITPTPVPTNIPVNNSLPGGGYSYQIVQSDIGNFAVSLIAADLSSTRAIVDSASDHDCGNDCPVMALGDYVSRNGGYAGINGSYFCPSTYPSCQDKKNSFDTLLMNVHKNYLNSSNNVYSVVPAVIFLGGSVRFVGRSLEWGRDTGNDGVLANQPLLLMGGNIQIGGSDDPKLNGRGPRGFVGNKGNVVYIGFVQNATVVEGAHVLKTLGIENAINLDSGGSTALYYNGYKLGPGRNIPNAIVFVKR